MRGCLVRTLAPLTMGARMGKRLKHEEDVFWGHDGTYIDIEGTQDIRQREREERGESKPEFVAPGAEQKWRARNLVDIHWALTAIKTPSESYNRVLSCIIDHANPHNGLCYPSQSIIAIETGYSVETVKRAIKWWKKQGFIKTESRGLGHALAYHPQWDLLEGFWVGVMSDIEEQKASRVTKGTYDVGHQGDLREGHQGDLREGHHADLQNLKLEPQTLTSMNEPHPERVVSPSVKATTPLKDDLKEEKKGLQERGEVERLSTNPPPPEGPSDGEISKHRLRLLPGSFWDFVSHSDFEAAFAAERLEAGAGMAVIQGAVLATKEGASDV